MTPHKSTLRQRQVRVNGQYDAFLHNAFAVPSRLSPCASVRTCGLFFILMILIVSVCAFASQDAFAEDIDTDPTPSQLQLEVERTAAALDEATQKADQAAIDLADNETRIAELKELIPGQQVRSDAAARELYKMNQQPYGILDALLSSRSLNDFIVQLDYVNRVTDANLNEIQRLTNMQRELEESQQALEQLKADAKRLRSQYPKNPPQLDHFHEDEAKYVFSKIRELPLSSRKVELQLMFTTGMRPCELCSLEYGNIACAIPSKASYRL